jgi:acetolactate synthase-1/2/3 large subunit
MEKQMKVAEYVAQRLEHLGLDTCFAVTGGGAMHLNDAFGEAKNIDCRYTHHEQSAAIAAEGYARIAGKPAILNVTTGPGAINSFNGVFGAYTDSIPMMIIAGQVRSDTISTENDGSLRQLGDQELRSMNMVKEITKASYLILDPLSIVEILDKAFLESNTGRPGPVWIEIPVNVQGMQIDADPSAPFTQEPAIRPEVSEADAKNILNRISQAKRPIIVSGSGVRIANVQDQVLKLAEITNTPITTAWTHDTISSDHELFAGRPGTIGTRPGNFSLQSADLVLVLGSRLNIRQVSYNWDSFAKNAEVIWLEIDQKEFDKPYLQRETITKIHADLSTALPKLIEHAGAFEYEHSVWVSWCKEIKNKYDVKESEYSSTSDGINSYHLIPELFRNISNKTSVVCGNATACIVPFQTAVLKDGMRLFSNSGSASMGYDLPASLGAAVADPTRKVVCLAGDGSIMMNIQELETLANWNADVLVIVLDNDGYLSIKQVQQNFFGHDHGASPKSGVTFPDFEKVASAFGVNSHKLDPAGDWKTDLKNFINMSGPRLLVAPLEVSQEFIPRLKSKMVNGTIQTPELDDMFPHIDELELENLRNSAKNL